MTKVFVLIISIFLQLASSAFGKEKKIDFDKDIRPILSDNCFHCHGPDGENREADLRLDTREGAIHKHKKGAGIVPGDPMASMIIKRMITDDQDDLMPPPDSNRKVTKKQIELLKQWIEEGAEWSEHWAFAKVKSAKVPSASNWVKNPIDSFIVKKIESLKLKPEGEADRTTLLRRLSLDLTGLPPTLQEVKNFVDDKSDNWYEKAVDRLLKSPHYGERMAWPWLDAARYSDTNGYQNDRSRTAWPWRDWVVKSFNDNMAFDQFSILQIAGDLLPGATANEILPTAFLRNHMINGEGGRIPEENRIEYIFDQLETVGTTWLGLTFNCCRCHDHKYDPISQKDYFAFSAFFNKTVVNGGGKGGQERPVLSIPPAKEVIAKYNSDIKTVRKKKTALQAKLTAEFKATQSKQVATSNKVQWQRLIPKKADALHQKLIIGKDSRILASGKNPENDHYTVKIKVPEKMAALKLEGLRHKSMTKGGISRSNSGNFVLTEIKLNILRKGKKIPLNIKSATASFEQKGFKVGHTFDSKKTTGWAVWNGKALNRDHYAVFILDQTINFEKGDELEIKLEHDSPHDHHNLGYFSFSSIDTVPAGGVTKVSSAKSLDELKKEFLSKNKELQNINKRESDLNKRFKSASVKVMVMKDETERKTFILNKGLYNQHGAEVTENVPEVLPPLPAGMKKDRLALAKWLMSPENPLTARVTINRLWAQVFGIGLVKTTENFGVQGERPVNAELLDWLAAEFIRSKWNVKHMMKLMVMSSAYRQSSTVAKEKLELDPYNRTLARGTRYRMPSWMIRDQALSASGLLNTKFGGAGVNPYQPGGVWAEMSFGKIRYVQGTGSALYRRSIYTFWRRIVAPTMFFDAAKRQVCEVKESRTNTPLQALAIMNDTTYVEAGRALAVRVLKNQQSDNGRITEIYRIMLGRAPDANEMKVLKAALKRLLIQYKDQPKLTEDYLQVGEFRIPADMDKVTAAAYANLCLLVINLDESLTRE